MKIWNIIFKFIILLNVHIKRKNFSACNNFNGIYIISSCLSGKFFSIKGTSLILSDIQNNFNLINIKDNNYYIVSSFLKQKIGVNNNKIQFYKSNKNINKNKLLWKLIKLNKEQYLIQNIFNKKYIESHNNRLICSNDLYSNEFNANIFDNSLICNNFSFKFFKLSEEFILTKKNLYIINKEPIDLVIKYIDLTDKSLNREGIKQIYKDNDNEELRYSLRSILEYIPWIRRIFLLMPNKKVKFLKNIDEINEKIIYIKDKDLLGYDSANIFAFTFNLHKLEKFNISKNFILMEDDFFIGKALKKWDFFYYDENNKNVLPYVLTKPFWELNKTELEIKFQNLYKRKDFIHPHSSLGWWLSIYNTEKYFTKIYNFTIITTKITHNAIAENIEDLKQVFEEIKQYEFINETLFSKERNILTLNQPHFVNLFQLNFKRKKIHSIPYKYINVEFINKYKGLRIPLFVINTSGNHQPLNRQYLIQKKVMQERFPLKNKYEILNRVNNEKYNIIIKKYYFILLKIFIILSYLKIQI